jgi:hypothetical protein
MIHFRNIDPAMQAGNSPEPEARPLNDEIRSLSRIRPNFGVIARCLVSKFGHLAQYGHVASALNGGVSLHVEREFHREKTGVLAVVNHCHGPEL